MSGNAAFISLGRLRVCRWPFAGPLVVPWIMAGVMLASCGERSGGESRSASARAPTSTRRSALTFTPTVGTAFAHGTVPALRDIALCADASEPITPPPNGTRPPGPFGAGLTPPLVNFEGTNGSQTCRCFQSNDGSGAIGPNHYVETTNCAVTVFDRAGHRLAGPLSTAALWSAPELAGRCDGSTFSDARPVSDASVAYDRVADRWVITRFGKDDGADNWNECFAVSDTNDPTGTYHSYGFFIDSPFTNDYPKLGVWPDAYYVTTLENFIDGGLGDFITAFDRQKMIDDDPAPGVVQFFLPAPAGPSPQGPIHITSLPAFADGPTQPPPGTPNYVVGLEDDDFGFPADRLQVYEFHVDWTNPSASTFTPTTSVVPTPFHSSVCSPTSGPLVESCLPQPPPTTVPGPVPGLFSLSFGNMMQRLAYRVFPDHESLMFNYTIAADDDLQPNIHSAIRWTELQRRGGDWSLAQEGTYAPDAHNRWVGSMAMDKDGDIALGYVAASSTLSASIRYTGRSAGAPPGTLDSEQTLVAGAGTLKSDPVGNFADYATMSIDPLDDCTFWLVNTYVAGDTQWIDMVKSAEFHTRIGAFKFGSCNNPPVARCKDVSAPANGSCQAAVSAANVDNGSTDADGDPLTCTLAPAGPFSLGGTPVTLTCADPSGATGSCTATVTVIDQTPPTLVPPPNKTVAICAESAVVAVGQATATDNCAHPVSVSGQVIAANGVTLTPPIPVVNGQVTLKAGTYTIRWTATDGTNAVTATQTVVVGGGIQAGQSFLVDDRGQVQNAAGGFGAVLNSGTGATRAGQDTRIGAILSRGAVTIQHRAIVNGDVVSASTVTKDSDATVTGTITQFGSVVLPPAPTLPAFPPPNLGGFTVNSGTTQNRPPGSYSGATMLNGGTLILAAGDYFFQSLTINSGSTLRATPTTRIFVQNTLVFNAPIRATSGTAVQAITLGFAGTTLGLFAPFNGTLIAPNAAVTFGTGAGLTYRGSFFGRTLEITPASVLVCSPS